MTVLGHSASFDGQRTSQIHSVGEDSDAVAQLIDIDLKKSFAASPIPAVRNQNDRMRILHEMRRRL
jgi:hypothetical protein